MGLECLIHCFLWWPKANCVRDGKVRREKKKNIFFLGATKSIETLDTTDPVQGSMCTTFFFRRQKNRMGGKKVKVMFGSYLKPHRFASWWFDGHLKKYARQNENLPQGSG